MKHLFAALAVLAVSSPTTTHAQKAEEAAEDVRDFDLPASEISDLVGDGGLDLMSAWVILAAL